MNVNSLKEVTSTSTLMRTVDLTVCALNQPKPKPLTDEVAFSGKLVKYYDQYKEVQDQIKEKPEILTDMIYNYMDKDSADEILSFLDGKNVTTVRYQHLLESDSSQADKFINDIMNGGYDKDAELFDEAMKNMSYEDFLTGFNKSISYQFRNYISGNKDGLNYMLLKVVSPEFENSCKFLFHSTNSYLVADSATYSTAPNTNEFVFKIAKPVGYGNKDNMTFDSMEVFNLTVYRG